MEIYKGELNTENKTINNILKRSKISLNNDELKIYINFFNIVHGAVVFVKKSFYETDWEVLGWEHKYDEQILRAIYILIQGGASSLYKDNWNNEEYTTDAVMSFDLTDVQVLEKISKKLLL